MSLLAFLGFAGEFGALEARDFFIHDNGFVHLASGTKSRRTP